MSRSRESKDKSGCVDLDPSLARLDLKCAERGKRIDERREEKRGKKRGSVGEAEKRLIYICCLKLISRLTFCLIIIVVVVVVIVADVPFGRLLCSATY